MYVSSQDVVQQWISDSKQTIIWNVSCSREKLLVSDNTVVSFIFVDWYNLRCSLTFEIVVLVLSFFCYLGLLLCPWFHGVIEQNPKISIQRIKLNPQLLISNSAVSFTCIVFCLLQDKSILVDKLCDVMCYTFVIFFFQDECFISCQITWCRMLYICWHTTQIWRNMIMLMPLKISKSEYINHLQRQDFTKLILMWIL